MSPSTPLVLLALLASPVRSQEPAQAPKEANYVLQLANGQSLRTRARELEGRWEIRRDGDWIALPAELVERATPEADLLRESRRLERAAGNDLALRVAHADWCMREGLVTEGLEELDRVLARDPDQKDARSLLERTDPPIALPEVGSDSGADRLRDFIAQASNAGPAAREVALQRLARASDATEIRSELTRSLIHRSPRIRSFGASAMRRLLPGQEVEALLGLAVLDASEDVRTEAARALRDVGDPAVIAPVVRALGSKTPEVRRNAIAALAQMNYPAAVEPLYARLVALQGGGASGGAPRSNVFIGRQFAYVQDYDVEVAQGQSIADPIINVGIEGASLEAAVTGVHEYVVQTERAALRSALGRLTGAEPGKTTQAWMRWWNDHGDEWLALANPQSGASYPSSREH